MTPEAQPMPLQVTGKYSPLFLECLNERAKAIALNQVLHQVVTPEGIPLTVVYLGRTVNGPVTDDNVRQFAEEVNEAATRGQIEYGAMYFREDRNGPEPLMSMQLSSQWLTPNGRKASLAEAVHPDSKLIERHILLFYAASRYTFAQLKEMNFGQRKAYHEEFAVPAEQP